MRARNRYASFTKTFILNFSRRYHQIGTTIFFFITYQYPNMFLEENSGTRNHQFGVTIVVPPISGINSLFSTTINSIVE